jgi:hypothetical protein
MKDVSEKLEYRKSYYSVELVVLFEATADAMRDSIANIRNTTRGTLDAIQARAVIVGGKGLVWRLRAFHITHRSILGKF